MRDVFHTIELQETLILLLLPQNRLKLLPGDLKEPGPCYMALTCTGLSAQMTSSKDCVYGPLPKQQRGPLEGKKRFQHLLEVSEGPFLQRWVLPPWSY